MAKWSCCAGKDSELCPSPSSGKRRGNGSSIQKSNQYCTSCMVMLPTSMDNVVSDGNGGHVHKYHQCMKKAGLI